MCLLAADWEILNTIGMKPHELAFLELHYPRDIIMAVEGHFPKDKKGFLQDLLQTALSESPTYYCVDYSLSPELVLRIALSFVVYKMSPSVCACTIAVDADRNCRKYRLIDIQAYLPTDLFPLLMEVPLFSNYLMENLGPRFEWTRQIVEEYKHPVNSTTKLKDHLTAKGATENCFLWFSQTNFSKTGVFDPQSNHESRANSVMPIEKTGVEC